MIRLQIMPQARMKILLFFISFLSVSHQWFALASIALSFP